MPSQQIQRWPVAWEQAATGPEGFWHRHRVGTQFRTPSSVSPVFAEAIAALLVAHPQIVRVIELGAGDATLIGALARLRPELRCVAVDVRAREPRLDGAVHWLIDTWSVAAGRWTTGQLAAELRTRVPTMIIAVEWLDELPLPTLVRDDHGRWSEVLVDAAGAEHEGPPAADADVGWARRWWPGGRRIEIGRSRDRAWAELVGSLRGPGGAALMIDYGHRSDDRPVAPAVRGYAGGRSRRGVPDGSVNLTCDVAVDAVAAAGERAGATTVRFARQAEMLAGVDVTDADPLSRLSARSARSVLTSAGGFGRYWWLLQQVAPK